MSCQICEHAIEDYEEIHDETFLIRSCELSGRHVDDDDTCPEDTFKENNGIKD